MHKIFFYRDRSGNEPVFEYLKELTSKTDKNSRINANKINDYIEILRVYGKHLDGEIWELRPLRNRILFVAWTGDGYVLLHHFIKKTQKTPAREIEKAKRELADLIERGVDYE